MPTLKPTAAIASLALAATLHAQPTILYVDDDAPSNGDGASWSSAFSSLNSALAAANLSQPPIEIRVGQGRYTPDAGSGDRNATFEITSFAPNSSLTFLLLGGFAGVGATDPDERDPRRFETTLSGDLAGNDNAGIRDDNSFCILRVLDAASGLRIDGFTFRGGEATASPEYTYLRPGAAIAMRANSDLHGIPVILRCRFISNRATANRPGAVSMLYGGVTFEDCQFEGNTGGSEAPGAVLATRGYEPLRLDRCRAVANSGGLAGVAHGDRIVCESSVLAGNTSAASGGAISSTPGGSAAAINSLLVANRALAGGAIAASYGSVVHSTITSNSAEFGGAVYCESFSTIGGILWGNTASHGDQVALYSFSGSAAFRDSIVEGGASGLYGFWSSLTTDGLRDLDPRFRDTFGPDGDPLTWEDNDYRLAISSPAINAIGYPSIPLALDLDGKARSVGGKTDIGAYEHQSPDCPSDFNADGFVDAIDYDRFIALFVTADPLADVNRDSFTDASDYDAFIRAFLEGC